MKRRNFLSTAGIGSAAAMLAAVNGYLLSLAALILLGGSLGDRFGRRRLFVVGTVWFGVASLLCGLAPDVRTLVAARVLQGVGGALLTPGSLAMIQASFAPGERARAIGAWSGLGGVAAAIGPLLGGWLVELASWPWVFLINAPLAAAVVVARVTPDDEPGNRIQWVAVALLVLIAIPAVVVPILRWRTTHYVITTHRVMVRRGVLTKSGKDITLSKITDVSFQRTVLDRMIGSGSLHIESAGDSPDEDLHNIPRSNVVQQLINRLVDEDDLRLRRGK